MSLEREKATSRDLVRNKQTPVEKNASLHQSPIVIRSTERKPMGLWRLRRCGGVESLASRNSLPKRNPP